MHNDRTPQTEVTFWLPYPVSVNAIKIPIVRKGKGGRYYAEMVKSPEAKHYDGLATAALIQQGVMTVQTPAEINVVAYPHDWRGRDMDNLLKLTVDAIVRHGIVPDDAWHYVRRTTAEFGGITPDRPRLEITVRTIPDTGNWSAQFLERAAAAEAKRAKAAARKAAKHG